jgi:hypothetical protein
MKSKLAMWAAIAIAAALVVFTIIAAAGSRTEPMRKLVVATLAERLNSDVELRAFSVDVVPNVTIHGAGLMLRLRARGDDSTRTDVPPLVQIDSFVGHAGIVDLFRRPRRFRQVRLDGLVVSIPPGGVRMPKNPGDGEPADAQLGASPIIVEQLQADGALLRIIPRREGKPAREFMIHTLNMQSLGVAERMPFKATLTNPLPKGLIEASGTFGPWHRRNPGGTPLQGRYTFAKADLGTIKGIGGLLDSTGDFAGELERIVVKGETHTPDFHLTISGQPVPLDTKFDALVDGTDGDTYLNTVDATFLRTSLTAKGAVVGTPGVKGRTVKLHVRVHEGRVEDLLRLSTKAKKPLMVGGVALHTDFTLPPGKEDVIRRLQLVGEFDVNAARFTDATTQQKLTGMSRRARGLDPKEEHADNVVSNMTGRFRLANGVLTFSELSFALPGATVRLSGYYGLRTEELSFDGTLRMQATISQAAGGGLKGFFLKIVDPVFRKQGSGAVLPIRIRGTVSDPKFGLDVGRLIKQQ